MRTLLAAACGALVLAGGARAAQVSAHLDAHALGTTESLQRYCAKIDPKAAARLGAKARRLEDGTPKGEADAVRRSDAYRKAYEAVSDFVAKVDAHNAARPCSQALAQGN